MKHTQKMIALMALIAASTYVTSCKKEEATAEENITTIEVHITGTGFDQMFFWNDTDGDGIANTIDSIAIPPNTANLQCHLHVYDRSGSPEIDLTQEIESENVDHLFVYQTNAADITISDLSQDANGKPFGLESVWTTGASTKGTVNIKLYHEPTNKTDASNPGGDIDFDVTFPVK